MSRARFTFLTSMHSLLPCSISQSLSLKWISQKSKKIKQKKLKKDIKRKNKKGKLSNFTFTQQPHPNASVKATPSLNTTCTYHLQATPSIHTDPKRNPYTWATHSAWTSVAPFPSTRTWSCNAPHSQLFGRVIAWGEKWTGKHAHAEFTADQSGSSDNGGCLHLCRYSHTLLTHKYA